MKPYGRIGTLLLMRYNRQLILPEIGEEGQIKLQKASVLIVGVGGLGSPIALYLAGAGVGTIGLVDDDVVSISNLQRQVLYTEDEVGQFKVACAAQRIGKLNSEITVRPINVRLTAENARNIIREYDLVVDGCDNFATRYLINDICMEQGKPYVYGAIREFEGQVSVFNYTILNHTVCNHTIPDHTVFDHAPVTPPSESPTPLSKNYRDLFPDEQAMLLLPPPPKGVLGVTPAIVGSVQATETLKIICGFGEILFGKLWCIDLRTWQTNIFSL